MARRPINPMPEDVGDRLAEAGAMTDFDDRPAYQRNDYLGWIERAKRPETRERRLRQMLNELLTGGVYMKMAHPPSAKEDEV